ncbi:MAG TPA: saccharopine dehydrogenase C-terminal domain-containing protein, partial [Candidatus Bipolaricaulota bacterium]
SPSDVLEEYTRLAYQVEDGREVVRLALSEVELLDFPEVGTLEAFNTDGLRSLRKTLRAPSMKEKTMRYPGHANLMRVFRESGFFSPEPVQLQGQAVSPLALTSKLLAQQWQLKEGEEDLTVMRVALEGRKKDQRYRYSYDLLDRYDAATGTTSMARTTGYTCSIVARQLAKGLWTQKGICPPEFLGRDPACFEHLMAEYAKRNIRVKETVTPL